MTTPGPSATITISPAGLPGPPGPAGGVLTPTTVKTGAFAAAAGELVPVDTTPGAVTITLPGAPADESVIAVKMVKQGGTNAVTITAAGSDRFNVAGGATSLTLTLLNQAATMQYSASLALWYVTGDDLALASLDGRYVQDAGDLGGTTSSPQVVATHLASPLPLAQGGTANTTGQPSGAASGDLAGSFPAPTVTAAHLSSPLPLAQGGTGQASAAAAYNALSPMTTLGDLEYESGAATAARLAGNTSAAKNFLTQTGNGSVSAAPAWGTIASGDMPAGTTGARGALQLDGTAGDIAALGAQSAGATGKAADAGHVHPGTGVVLTSALPLAIASGGTGQATAAAGLSALGGAAVAGDLGNTSASPQVLSTHLSAPLPLAQGGSGAGSASAARTSLGVAYDTTASDIKALGAQSAGSSGLVPNSDHVHPATGVALLAGATFTGGLVTQIPNIVFDGDSLTIGSGALPFNNFPNSNDYPSQVVGALDHRGTYYNVGVAGETIATMITNAPTVVDTKLVTGAGNVVCIWGGTNDLYYGATATTTYNSIVSYCQARQAAGWKVIVGTITPRSSAGTPGSFNASRLTVNTNIRANWTNWANGLADIGADPNMGTSGQEANTQYYNGDLVHFNPHGYRVMAGYVLAALGGLGIIGCQHGDLPALGSDLWIPPAAFGATAGSPTFGPIGNTATWQLPHGSVTQISTSLLLPTDWQSFATQVWWTNTTGGAGNAYLRGDLLPLFSASNLLSGNLVGSPVIGPGPTTYAVLITTLRSSDNVQTTGSPSRTIFDFHILRVGNSGSDTLTDVAAVVGAYIYRLT